MPDEIAFSDFLIYLDSVQSLYPGGVPKQYVDQEYDSLRGQEVQDSEFCDLVSFGNSDADLLIFTVFERGVRDYESFQSGSEGQLLNNALLKGMKIEPDTICFAGLEKNSSESGAKCFRAAALKLLNTVKPGIALICGSGLAESFFPELNLQGRDWVEFNGVELLLSDRLDAVLSDLSVKKEFWKDLQKVMGKLRVVEE